MIIMNKTMSGSNVVTMRENNLSLIIRLIHKAKICSRADLAIQTGLKQATITNIINDLIDWGLVKETGNVQGRLNRRSIGITLNNEVYRIFSIRLNRDYVTVGLFDITGSLIDQRQKYIDTDPNATMEAMCTLVKELYPADKNVLGIGVAIPGPFVPKKGKIELMSGVPGWQSVDITGRLEDYFSLPVFLEHDANCGALAELWYGDIGGFEDVIFVAADVGVGAGILTNGKLYTGSLGTAGEIGHMSIDYGGLKCECGNRGCLELYCSTKALQNEYKKEAINTSLYANKACASVEDILHDVVSGDVFARQVFERIARFLAIGLVNVVNAFNPSLIIISDKLALAGDYLIEVVSQTLKECLLGTLYDNLEIRLGSFNKESMLFGASALVLENLLHQPSVSFNPLNQVQNEHTVQGICKL